MFCALIDHRNKVKKFKKSMQGRFAIVFVFTFILFTQVQPLLNLPHWHFWTLTVTLARTKPQLTWESCTILWCEKLLRVTIKSWDQTSVIPSSLPGRRKNCGYVIKLSLLNTWFGDTLEQPMEFLELLQVPWSKKNTTPGIGHGKYVFDMRYVYS